MQRPLQKQLLGLGEVDATQGSLWQSVGGHQSQAVHPHLVDAVYGLKKRFEHGETWSEDLSGVTSLLDLFLFSQNLYSNIKTLNLLTVCNQRVRWKNKQPVSVMVKD